LIRLAELDIGDPAEVRVAHVRGELDLSNTADIADALAIAAEQADLGIVVDMSQLRHIDSAGVRLLFDLRRRLGRHRQHLALAVPADSRIREVLEMTAVHQAMPVAASVEEAVDAVRAAGAS
jgi:anti-anti-sigma factor